MKIKIPQHGVYLFQGDSITDANRNRADGASLGSGYALMASGLYGARNPACAVKFLNRGISGDRVKNLEARWTEECLALKPDVLSILIGINDVWRRYDAKDPTSAEIFETGYRRLLERVRRETKATVLLLEPFLLHVSAERETWREDLDPKRAAVRKMAREFDTLFIPLDELFTEAAKGSGAAFWAADGVHPTPAGHALIAQAVLENLE